MKKLALFATALAALAAISCSKHDDSDEPWIEPEIDYCEFQLHYFVPDLDKQTIVADAMQVMDGIYYASAGGSGLLYSYNGLPNTVMEDGSILPRFFMGWKGMEIKLFKEKNLVYDQKISNIENGGRYHLVIYDLTKEPAFFPRISIPEDGAPSIRIKFANFLFQNPTTKYAGTLRLQYAHQDDDTWYTVGKALNFGEATDSYSINITDPYEDLRFRVIDKDGCVITSGEDGTDVALTIKPDLSFKYYVFFAGGNLEDGTPAELFQWRSL